MRGTSTVQNDPAGTTDTDLTGLVDELGTLTTEQFDPDRRDLDLMSTRELVVAMNAEDARVADAVAEQAAPIAHAVDGIVERLRRGGRLIYLGAGTAGRLGVLDASECPPTFGTDPSLIIGLVAGGSSAIHTAVEGAEDDLDAARFELSELGLTPEDVVVGVSASGRTPYVVGGLTAAGAIGSLTIAVACNSPSAIGRVSDIPIEVIVGPEFVAGSTRLKAGTAQKLVLNMLTTLSMIRLGKTYRGVMVDLQATNEKLRARSIRTVAVMAGASLADAAAALERTGGAVKQAILVLRAGITPEAAATALDAAGGMLAHALERTR
jgi:N-acetylmuramic acid 6-phosphate etherase